MGTRQRNNKTDTRNESNRTRRNYPKTFQTTPRLTRSSTSSKIASPPPPPQAQPQPLPAPSSPSPFPTNNYDDSIHNIDDGSNSAALPTTPPSNHNNHNSSSSNPDSDVNDHNNFCGDNDTPPRSNSNSPPPSTNNYDDSIHNIDDGSNSGLNYDDNDAAYKLALAMSLSETPQHAANSEIIASSAAEFLGMCREIIPADGFCMFRCLAAEAAERLEFDGDHLEMKKVLIDYICANWGFFSSFFLQNEEGEPPVGEKAREYYSTTKAYRASMMNSNKAWGGSAELSAFEAIFDLKVYTMKVTKKGFSLSNMDGTILSEFDIENPTRHDDVPKGVFLYHAGGPRGTHFDRLIDAADEEEEQQEEEKEKLRFLTVGGTTCPAKSLRSAAFVLTE